MFRTSLLYVLLLSLLRRPTPSDAEGSVGIYPSVQYFGGTKTKPTMTCQPSQPCFSSVKWFFGQNEINTKSSKYSTSENLSNNYLTLTLNGATQADAGNYHCQCTFSGKAANSPVANLIHTEPVTFDTEDNLIYQGDDGGNVTLICNIKDYVEFQWQFHDKTVVPNNDKYQYQGTNLLIDKLSVSDNMTYLCVGNNQITNINKIGAQLIVYKQPNVTVNGETSVMVEEGESVSFNCTAEGNPQPTVIWSRSGGVLNIGGKISKKEIDVDEFTKSSHLTINHVSTSDQGNYLCTGESSSLNKQASFAKIFTLSVHVPPGPLFQLFTLAKNHNSINVSWILSGVSSNMVNVSWSTADGNKYQVHFSNTSSVVISDLVPSTLYQITAEVIGSQLTDNVNETTDPLVSTPVTSIPVTTSSVLVHSPTVSSSTSTTVFGPRVSTSSSSSTESRRQPPRTSVRVHSTTSTIPIRPEPSIEGARGSDDGLIVTAVPVVVTVLVLVILVGIIVTVFLCVINKARRSSSGKNLQSLERANSSRSSQALLQTNGSMGNLQQYPSSSNCSSNPSLQIQTTTGGGEFVDHHQKKKNEFSYHPPAPSFSSNHKNSSHSKLPYPLPPPSYGASFYVAGQNEPFEMMDNPVNADYESSQVATPTMTYNEYFEDSRGFPFGDSVSQVMYSSQSQNCFEHNEPSTQSFDYTKNSHYESLSFKPYRDPPPLPPSVSNLPLYENNSSCASTLHATTNSNGDGTSSNKPPTFGIVESGRRGVVREQVEIKLR